MSRIKRPHHVHLRRLEDDGVWRIVRTAEDGDDLVRWLKQQAAAGTFAPGVSMMVDCEKFVCAPGGQN